jgi:AraC-like DNA-binding protein
MNYITLFGAMQAMICLLLLPKGGKRQPANNMLMWMMVCICAHLLIKFSIYAPSGVTPLKAGFNTFLDTAYGPLIWMYARKIRYERFNAARFWYLFVPTFFSAVVYLAILFIIWMGGMDASRLITVYNMVTEYMIVLSLLVFPVLSIRISLKLSRFWISERRLIQRISALFLIVPFIWLYARPLKGLYLPIPDQYVFRFIIYSSYIVICLLIIRYRFGMQMSHEKEPLEMQEQPIMQQAEAVELETREDKISVQIAASDMPDKLSPAPSSVFKKSTLTLERQTLILRDLQTFMQSKRLYADADLSLEKLSTLTKIPRHHISESLNHLGQLTFYQFINEFRIMDVIRDLDKCKKQRITPNFLSLAYEAGFNSKSSFNHYFKKTTGCTPSEYLKKEQSIQTPLSNNSGLVPAF